MDFPIPNQRKRSILVNGTQNSHADAESIYSHHSHSDIKAYGEFKQKLAQPEPEINKTQLEESWIYTFCIKCRGEDNTPSWEPPMWQKFCKVFVSLIYVILFATLLNNIFHLLLSE